MKIQPTVEDRIASARRSCWWRGEERAAKNDVGMRSRCDRATGGLHGGYAAATTVASSLFIEPGRLRRIFRDGIVPHLSNRFALDRASSRVRQQRMRHKRIVKIGITVLVGSGTLAGGVYYLVTKDPTPIHLDARIYNDYVGYYIFPNGYPVTVRREGDRLLTSIPEHAPAELLPE